MDTEKNLKENKKYLNEFKKWLKNKGLTPKTIESHMSNADLYINDYLVYYEDATALEGIGFVCSFLGDWFIRKCMWSSASSIRSTAASIKKFYQCMCENGHVNKEDYDRLCDMIKQNIDRFINTLYEYEDEDDDYNDYDFI